MLIRGAVLGILLLFRFDQQNLDILEQRTAVAKTIFIAQPSFQSKHRTINIRLLVQNSKITARCVMSVFQFRRPTSSLHLRSLASKQDFPCLSQTLLTDKLKQNLGLSPLIQNFDGCQKYVRVQEQNVVVLLKVQSQQQAQLAIQEDRSQGLAVDIGVMVLAMGMSLRWGLNPVWLLGLFYFIQRGQSSLVLPLLLVEVLSCSQLFYYVAVAKVMQSKLFKVSVLTHSLDIIYLATLGWAFNLELTNASRGTKATALAILLAEGWQLASGDDAVALIGKLLCLAFIALHHGGPKINNFQMLTGESEQ